MESTEAVYGGVMMIWMTMLKIRYSFGMPPHRADREIIDLGEFPMEMRAFTPLHEE